MLFVPSVTLDVESVLVALVPLQVPFSVRELHPFSICMHWVGVGVGVRVKVKVGTCVPPDGTRTRTMEAAGRVTGKLAPVVMELPVPGMEVTEGNSVPLMVMRRRCRMGVEAPVLVVPELTIVQMLPFVPAEKPLRATLVVTAALGSLLTMNSVR
jgi:hypothetical protein